MKKIIAACFLPLCTLAQKPMEYPAAEKSAVTDDYFGTKVADPYRWLEETGSPKTLLWLDEQAKAYTKFEKKLSYTSGITTKLQKYAAKEILPFVKKGKYYFRFNTTDYPSQLLYTLSVGEPEKTAFQAESFKNAGHTIPLIREYEVSADDRFVSFALQYGNDPVYAIHIYNIDKQRMLPDAIVHAASAKTAWHGNGFFYIRLDSAKTEAGAFTGAMSRGLYYHKVGTDAKKDQLVYTPATDNGRYLDFEVSNDETCLLVHDRRRSGEEARNVIQYAKLDLFPAMNLKTCVETPVSTQGSYKLIDASGNTLFFTTDIGSAARRVMVIELDKPGTQPRELIKAYKNTLVKAGYSGGKLICLYYLAGAYSATVFDTAGKSLKSFNFPVGCAVEGFEAKYYDKETYYYVSSFYFPTIAYKLDLEKLSSEPLQSEPLNFDPNKFETRLLRYKRSDSTDAVIYVTCKKGMKPDGTAALWLKALKGQANRPAIAYDPSDIVWVENGGILAVAAVGDLHHAGMKAFHENVSAATAVLVEQKYANPAKLAVDASALEGLQAEMAVMHKPELFKAMILTNPLTDALRGKHYTDVCHGMPGAVETKQEFENVYAVSPLQHVQKGRAYPSTLIVEDDSDPSCAVTQGYKMMASLQDNDQVAATYILRTEQNAGKQDSDVAKNKLDTRVCKLSFLFKALEMDPQAVFGEQ